MTREAFELSERFARPGGAAPGHAPRAQPRGRRGRRRGSRAQRDPQGARACTWILLPGNARRQWQALLDRQPAIQRGRRCLALEHAHAERQTARPGRHHHRHRAQLPAREPARPGLGALAPAHRRLPDSRPKSCARWRPLRARPGARGRLPVRRAARCAASCRGARAIAGTDERRGAARRRADARHRARRAGPAGAAAALSLDGLVLPKRPPQLCQGCPHGDAYAAIKEALRGYGATMVTSDIGCYTLGALPPYSAIESCVCMGASIGMARGAAEAGFAPGRRRDRRQHVPALGHHAADGRGGGRHRHDAAHPRQRDHGDDRRAGPARAVVAAAGTSSLALRRRSARTASSWTRTRASVHENADGPASANWSTTGCRWSSPCASARSPRRSARGTAEAVAT